MELSLAQSGLLTYRRLSCYTTMNKKKSPLESRIAGVSIIPASPPAILSRRTRPRNFWRGTAFIRPRTRSPSTIRRLSRSCLPAGSGRGISMGRSMCVNTRSDRCRKMKWPRRSGLKETKCWPRLTDTPFPIILMVTASGWRGSNIGKDCVTSRNKRASRMRWNGRKSPQASH